MRRAIFLSLALALASVVRAQQPPVKTVTTGVVIDATVVDARGIPVLDLAPEDFELKEDGVRQRIVSATLVHHGVVRPLGGTMPARADTPSPNAAPAPSAPQTSVASAPSATAILFDRLSPESRAMARRAALAYVSTLTPPNVVRPSVALSA